VKSVSKRQFPVCSQKAVVGSRSSVVGSECRRRPVFDQGRDALATAVVLHVLFAWFAYFAVEKTVARPSSLGGGGSRP